MSQIQSFSRLSAILTMDNTQFLRGTEVASKRLATFSRQATTFGANITRSLGVGFALVGTAAVSAAADFDRAQATLGALVSGGELKELEKQSRELGRTTIFTATSVAKGQLEIAKLGFSAEETASIIGNATDVATVFSQDVEGVGKTIAATLNQFKLPATEAARVADVMAVAFSNTALDLPKFREAMKNIAPTAKALGFSLEETVAFMGKLSDAAIDGSLGGTKLRSALSDLAKDSDEAKVALDALIEGNLTYGQLLDVVNKRGALAVQVLSDNGVELKELTKQLQAANGEAKGFSEAVEGSLFYNVERLRAAVESLGISVGNAFAPTIQGLADSLGDFAEALDDMDPGKLQTIIALLKNIAVGGLLSLIAGQLAGLVNAIATFALVSVPNFAAAVASFSASASLMATAIPVAAIVAAIAAVSLAVDDFFAKMDELGDRNLERFIESSERAAKKMKDLSAVLFDLLEADERLEGGGLGKKLGLESELEAVEALEKAKEQLAASEEKSATREAELQEARLNGTREELKAASRRAGFVRDQVAADKERVREIERFLELLRKNVSLNEEIERQEERDKVRAYKVSEVTFDSEKFRRSLQDEFDAAPIRIFGQNFAFDLLSSEDQLAALLNGQTIQTLDEFAQNLEPIEIDLFEEDDFFADEFAEIDKLADTFIRIREEMGSVTGVAQSLAQTVGDAFLQARQGAVSFGEALKTSFLNAFQAIIAKLITLITLYTILAIVSGGASMKAGGSFGKGVGQFGAGNPLGQFLGQGFGMGRSASAGGSVGGSRSVGINVGGGLMGGDIAFAANSGVSANDRRFG